MTTLTFDTLAYVKTLREAGISEPQAEAQASALAEAMKSSAGDLATKQDLAILEERTRGRFTLLQWLLGCNLALTVAIFWMLILGAH